MTPAGAWRLPRRPARAPRWLWAGIGASLLLHLGAAAWLLWRPAATLPHVVEATGVEMLWQGKADGEGAPQPAPPGAQGDAPASAPPQKQVSPSPPAQPPVAQSVPPPPAIPLPPIQAGAMPEAAPPQPALPPAPQSAPGSPAARPGATAEVAPAETLAPALTLPAAPPATDTPAVPTPRFAEAPRGEVPPQPAPPSAGDDPAIDHALAATTPQPGPGLPRIAPVPAPPAPQLSPPSPPTLAMPGAPLPESPVEDDLPTPPPAPPAPVAEAPPRPAPTSRPSPSPAPPRPAVPPAPSAAAEALGTVRLGAMASLGENRSAQPQDPKCLEAIPYPEEAQRDGLAGRVALRMRITDKGRVIAADITESSGSLVLDDAARSAARRCRFDPFLRDGVPAWGTIRTVIEFRPRPPQRAR